MNFPHLLKKPNLINSDDLCTCEDHGQVHFRDVWAEYEAAALSAGTYPKIVDLLTQSHCTATLLLITWDWDCPEFRQKSETRSMRSISSVRQTGDILNSCPEMARTAFHLSTIDT